MAPQFYMPKGGTSIPGGPQHNARWENQDSYKHSGYPQQQTFGGGSNQQWQQGGYAQDFSTGGPYPSGNQQWQHAGGHKIVTNGGNNSPWQNGGGSKGGNVQKPAFAPPNSTPYANGETAWCNRCGTSNHVKASQCSHCNLALLVSGYNKGGVPFPSEPPPGNHALHSAPQQSVYAIGGQHKGNTHAPLQQSDQQLGGQYNATKSSKGGGKGFRSAKWCQQCGHPNKPFHTWCNSCHAQLPYTGKGGDPTVHQQGPGVAQGQEVFLKGGKYFPGGAKPPAPTPGQQAPYSLDPQRFSAESTLYPGRIPRCFEVNFEVGQYIAPVNLSPIQQWKTNVEYLNHIKMMQSKVDTYKSFLQNVENKLIAQGLPAWKHHKEMEANLADLPNQALGRHNPPLHLVAQLLSDQITDNNQKSKFNMLMTEILHAQAPPTPRPHHAQTPPHAAGPDFSDQDDGYEDDQYMEPVNLNESFEIPQWQAPPEEIVDEAELEYLAYLQDEPTPCLPKRQRIHGKTQHNDAILGRRGQGMPSEAELPPAPPSDSDLESMSKSDKKAELKRRKKAAQQQAATTSPSHSRKTINKPKQR